MFLQDIHGNKNLTFLIVSYNLRSVAYKLVQKKLAPILSSSLSFFCSQAVLYFVPMEREATKRKQKCVPNFRGVYTLEESEGEVLL